MLLKHLIATTALSLALTAPAVSFAADPVPPPAAASTLNIKADALIKADLKTMSGDRIGEVESVLLDKSGKSQAVVVDVGGFLGVGEHRVALAWTDLTIAKEGKEAITRFTKDQLKAMPAYKYPDAKQRNTAFHDPNWFPSGAATRAGGGTATDPAAPGSTTPKTDKY